MKLGLCYMVFDGEELLEFAARSVRPAVDHISVTYQDISYFGNPAGPELKKTLDKCQKLGLIDELIHFKPNLSLHHKDNELKLRNIGLEASRKAGCTHHISSDVDEFLTPEQLQNAKNLSEGYDFVVAPYEYYYKDPTYRVTPNQGLLVTLIHPVDNKYVCNKEFPFKIEITRRFPRCEKYRVLTLEECTVHHMSYVRKDIRKKYANNDNQFYIKLKKFYAHFENYKVGERVCLLPDYINRKTTLVENTFGIIL